MVDFASLDGMGGNIPSSGGSVDPMSLTTPNSMITGTMAGQQYLGGPNIFVDSVNSRIGVQQGSTPQVLMGKHPTLGEGFFVSKNGVNVVSNTDPSQFIFNSSQDVFKIVKTDTVNSAAGTINGVASQYYQTVLTATFPHGLNTTPIAIGAINISGTYYMLPTQITSNSSGSFSEERYRLATDATNLYITNFIFGFNGSSAPADVYSIKYYLLQETAN